MRNLLFQDTESTGLLDFKKDLMAEGQPRICALAASLTDEQGNIIDEMDVLIKPDGWDIEPGAAAVHGLTVEKCEAEGIPMQTALARYYELKEQCQVRIGANPTYDRRLLAREGIIYNMVHSSDGIDKLDLLPMAKSYCRIPPSDKMMAAGRRDYKTPKLSEAYEVLVGKPMENAHTAMGDVRACQAVYFELMRRMRGVEGAA